MTQPNEVKYKVRAIALDLETFTVAQVARVTALNPASIRTELQRMKRKGYLTSEPLREGKRRRGAPPHRYQLTDDPEKRLALARSIQPFDNPHSTNPRGANPTFKSPPSSLHYQAALTLAGRLEGGEASSAECEAIWQDAQHHLALAAEEEGIGIHPTEETVVAAAYLDLLRARLSIAVGQWKQAEPWLTAARRVFAENGLAEKVTQADALQTALKVERMLAQTSFDSTLPDRLLATLGDASGTLPLSTVRRIVGAMRNT